MELISHSSNRDRRLFRACSFDTCPVPYRYIQFNMICAPCISPSFVEFVRRHSKTVRVKIWIDIETTQTHMPNYRRRECEYLFIVFDAHSFTSIRHCSAYVRYDCSVRFSLECVAWMAAAACASTPPHLDRGMSDIFVNIINLFSRYNIGRWVEIRQTAEPTKKRNLVDFIPIGIIFESICFVNTHGEAHRALLSVAAAVALIRYSGRCLIFTFILFISIFFFITYSVVAGCSTRFSFHFVFFCVSCFSLSCNTVV